MNSEIQQKMIEMLTRDNDKLLNAGNDLAEASSRVIRDYDGLHRLSIAVANWHLAIANQGDRDIINNPKKSKMFIHTKESLEEFNDYIEQLNDTVGLKPETYKEVKTKIAQKQDEIKRKEKAKKPTCPHCKYPTPPHGQCVNQFCSK